MNCHRTRVQPIFTWLRDRASPDWPAELLALCEGLQLPGPANGRVNGRKPRRGKKHLGFAPGAVLRVDVDREHKVKASPSRLAWMIRNVQRLVPRNDRKWREFTTRIQDHPQRDEALALLDSGTRKSVAKKLILEGPAQADCLIECEHLILWIVGKRQNWLKLSSKWDITRDELARDLEAVWGLALADGKECCLILCHEHRLKHHEEAVIEGYRSGSWSAGWPHLEQSVRRRFGQRIGTVSWGRILAHWPELSELPALANLEVEIAR